ncbi:MAG: hypothetical protein ABI167_11210 [Nitrosospira sp.]
MAATDNRRNLHDDLSWPGPGRAIRYPGFLPWGIIKAEGMPGLGHRR